MTLELTATWSIYLIRCADESLYTGISTDVERRFSEHQHDTAKGARYLRGRGPLELVFHRAVGDRSEASRMECMIKRLPRQTKLRLINGELSLLQVLS